MKNLREEYIIDSFVDFTGQTRKFVIAAISEDIEDTFIDSASEDCSVTKRLVLGISVCDPKDEFNEELGKRIAKGRALNDRARCTALYSTEKGVINTSVVKTLLEQETEYMKQNPGKYIRSYDLDKREWQYAKSITDAYNGMDEVDRRTVNVLKGKTKEELREIINVALRLGKK